MTPQTHIIPAPAVELAGDPQRLLEQLGSPAGLASFADVSELAGSRPIENLPGLRTFLEDYQARILGPLELPAIQRAFQHASRHELRELIAYDQQLAGEPALQPFASASRLSGQQQLQRLRPLHDERLVKRYLAAVETGAANGWHTLAFGLTLAVYSLPLRQGLYGYAQLAINGFIQAASRSLTISRDEARALGGELCERLPATIEALVAFTVA